MKHTRIRCRSCRFKKCTKEGMSIDGIRMGRIPKVAKLKSLTSIPSPLVEVSVLNRFIYTDSSSGSAHSLNEFKSDKLDEDSSPVEGK